MTRPIRNGSTDPDFKLEDELVTKATFPKKEQIATILEFLKNEKLTGTLVVDINIGGITRTHFVQNQPVDIV